MRILITGAGGFVGFWAAERLKRLKIDLVGFDRLPPSGDQFSAWRQGDVTDYDALVVAMTGCDVVLHCAVLPQYRSADDPVADLRVNTLGTLQALRAAKEAGISQFVLPSSSAVYGSTATGCLHEDTNLRPHTPYGVSKAAAELYCNLFHSEGLHTTILRFFNIFGLSPQATLRDTVEGHFLRAVLAGDPPTIYGNPRRSFDFVHIEDVTRVIEMVIFNELPSGLTLNVGSGQATSLQQLAAWCMEAAGIEGEPIRAPGPDDASAQVADLSRIKHYLDYIPQHPLRDWIDATIAQYRI